MNPPRNVGCKVDGCDQPHRSLGYCSLHYMRFHRHGDPLTLLTPTPAKAAAKMRKGQRIGDSLTTVPTGGTVTLAEYRRLRALPAAGIHIIAHHGTPGNVA